MTRVCSALSVLLLMIGIAVPVAAQDGAQFQITPFAGGVAFTQDLADITEAGLGLPFVRQSLTNSGAFGTHVGVRFGQLAVEGTVGFAPTTLVTPSSEPVESTENGVEAEIGVTQDQTVLLLGGSVLYYLPVNPFLEAYLAGGVGAKNYTEADFFGGWDAGETDLGFNLGAGLELAVSRSVGVRLDVRDWVSTFDAFANQRDQDPDEEIVESETQHDIFWNIGLRIRP